MLRVNWPCRWQILGCICADASAFLFPNAEDRNAAIRFLQGMDSPVIALHPGSGSEKKNWPIQNWIDLGNYLLGEKPSRSGDFPVAELPSRRFGKRRSLVVVSGEADERRTTRVALGVEKQTGSFRHESSVAAFGRHLGERDLHWTR